MRTLHDLVALCAALSLVPALSSPGSAQTEDVERLTYSSSDKNLSFSYPKGWQVTDEGGKLRLAAPDGAKYVLLRDTLSPLPTGDPANNAGLRDTAGRLALSLLTQNSYAGVRPLTVDAGAGAIYRFRGRGTKSDADLAEVWCAIIGPHSIVLLPDTAPQPAHSYELSTVFRSLAFADAPRKEAGGRRATPVPKAPANPPVAAATRSVSTNGTTASSAVVVEMERYEGHLVAGDAGFTLHIDHGSSASAEWTRAPGHTMQFAGTYTGQDGNYEVKLTRAAATSGNTSLGPQTLTLVLQSLGGMTHGQYGTDSVVARRDIAELKLTAVDAGNLALHGSKPSNRSPGSRLGNRQRGNRRR